MNEDFLTACSVLPAELRRLLLCLPEPLQDTACEIVLRRDGPVYIVCPGRMLFLLQAGGCSPVNGDRVYKSDAGLLRSVLLSVCGYSMYARRKELDEGCLSYGKGCRLGICSDEPGKPFCMNRVGALRLRIARRIDCPTDFIHGSGTLLPTLIAGAPGSGKTTVLRSIVSSLSGRYRVSVIDERGELCTEATMAGGTADFISRCEKSEGILQAVRLFNPEVIVCDEIGTEAEALRMEGVMNTGVLFMASIHAGNPDELCRRACFRRLAGARVFRQTVFLAGAHRPGTTVFRYDTEELMKRYGGVDSLSLADAAVCG